MRRADLRCQSGQRRIAADRPKLQPEPHPQAQQKRRRIRGSTTTTDYCRNFDAERIKLWRKILTFGLVLALPLLYFYRQSQVIQLQTRSSSAGWNNRRATAIRCRQESGRGFPRLQRYQDPPGEIGKNCRNGPAGADRSVGGQSGNQRLNDEKKRLQDIVRAVAEKIWSP